MLCLALEDDREWGCGSQGAEWGHPEMTVGAAIETNGGSVLAWVAPYWGVRKSPDHTSSPHWQSQALCVTGSESGAPDHDESIVTADLLGDFSSIATNTMRPRRHCGHCRNDEPVRSS
jgi:hypothetical protein